MRRSTDRSLRDTDRRPVLADKVYAAPPNKEGRRRISSPPRARGELARLTGNTSRNRRTSTTTSEGENERESSSRRTVFALLFSPCSFFCFVSLSLSLSASSSRSSLVQHVATRPRYDEQSNERTDGSHKGHRSVTVSLSLTRTFDALQWTNVTRHTRFYFTSCRVA